MEDLTVQDENNDGVQDNTSNYIPVDKSITLDVPFTPFDHTTAQAPADEALANFGGNYGGEIKQKPGFIKGVVANWEDKNETWRLLHGGWDRVEDYLDGYKDPNFNPLQFKDKFTNINPEYQGYLLASENEPQMNFRLKRIYHEQAVDDTVKNGSWMQWLVGGGAAIPSDAITYIPVMSQVKYGMMSKTLLRSVMHNAPASIAFGVAGSLGEQVDRINGNMKEFLTDSMVRSVFATALFSASPVASLALDKMELWKLQSYVVDAINGVGYKLKIGEKGAVEGLQAYSISEAGSAMKVKLAQDKADSAFYKAGVFKIPYIGTAAEKLMSNPAFGSTAVSMLLSPYESVRMVLDLAYDHGMITKALAEGKARPVPFFTRMQQMVAEIRQEHNIFNALHMERNGVDSTNYVAQNLKRGGMAARQKSLEMLGAEIGDRPYISPHEFAQEVEQVMRTGESHQDGAVNEAASMFKKSMDVYYKNWRIANNLPEDFLPPITARQYLMRVYDTQFLNNNLYGPDGWINVISNELREQDKTISNRMAPITELETQIKDFKAQHTDAVRELGTIKGADSKVAIDSTMPERSDIAGMQLRQMGAKLRALKEQLQDEIRANPQFHLLSDDWNALSSIESKELTALLKPVNDMKASIEEQEANIRQLKAEKSKQLSAAKRSETKEKAKPKAEKFVESEDQIPIEERKLFAMQRELYDMQGTLETDAQSGKINKRFFKTKDNMIEFKNPDNKLKFRDTYHQQPGYRISETEAHEARMAHAKAYYDTIMNQTAEDTINQIMGKFTGNQFENHTKQRTIMIHDDVLYKYNFMSKDLLSKVANYKMWLGRRTALKNTFAKASIEGGFEPILRDLQKEFDDAHVHLNENKAAIQERLKEKELPAKQKVKLENGLEQVEKEIKKARKAFNRGKKQVQFAYEKMAGISKIGVGAKQIVSGTKAFNVFANLGFLPVAMITDLSANGLKQGLVPFIQAGLYPTIQSLFGLLKTHDSQSFRECFGALNLGLHHIGNTTASRQMDLSTNPYLNLGRIPAALDKIAHFASNINLTTTIDNYLQQVTSAVAQSNVIRHMVAFSEGRLTKADRMWLNRYGLDPEKDSEAILKAFKKNGGGTNGLGGYQSNFWHWEDLKSANKVSDAVFRSTHDTIISANSLDSPMWLDENGGMGMFAPIIRGFKGWAFASLNRYLIPTLQQPDAQKLMGFALMTASAALVSPSRRMAKGDAPYREDQTAEQIMAEIVMDSPQFAWFSEAINDFNLISGGTLLGKLKNDKYYDRTRIGAMGPTASNANKLFNFVDALATGNMNEKDAMGMASMIPVVNSLYGYDASKHIIEGFGLPKRRGG